MIKRDFRYILKRVIIGFSVGMLLFLCKGKIAFASVINDYYSKKCYTFHYKPCIKDGTTLKCGYGETGTYLPDIPVTDCSDTRNDATGLYTTNDLSFLLASVDVSITHQNGYLDYYYFNYDSSLGLIPSSTLQNEVQANDGFIYGWIDTAIYPGYYSVLGSRVSSCSYLKEDNATTGDCLSNMSYINTYGTNQYKNVPVFNFYDNNNPITSGGYKTLEFTIGVTSDTFTIEESDLLDYFAMEPVIVSEFLNYTDFMPLAYYNNRSNPTYQIMNYIHPDTSYGYFNGSAGNAGNYVQLPTAVEPPYSVEESLTEEQQQIVDSVNDIFAQFTPEFWESIQSGTGVTQSIIGFATGDTSSILGGFVANDFATGFTGLFEAMFQTPLDLFESHMSYDLWNGSVGNTNYNYCLGTHVSGSALDPPSLRLWEYKTGNSYRYYSVDLPCMTDMYSKIVSPSGNYGFTTFYPIYRTIIDGILIYWVLVQVLQFYKYCIEPKDSSIEVLDL